MVKILPCLLNQVALYWDIGALTESGRRDYSSVTPVEIPCHWTNEVKYITTSAGDTPKATSRVVTSYEVKMDGVLWLSTAHPDDPAGTAIAQTPTSVPTHQKIEYVERHYSISADEIMYKAYV